MNTIEQEYRINNDSRNPGAVVIDGHGQADLGVVRALGETGIPVYLATSSRENAVVFSRFVTRIFPFPQPKSADEEKVQALLAIGRQFRERPVFFSTGDSSLLLFSRNRSRLEEYFRHHIGDAELVEICNDKMRFAELARSARLAVPISLVPRSREELLNGIVELKFPVMAKPSEKKNWDQYPEVYRIVNGNLKGVKIQSAEALVRLYDDLTPYDNRIVIQEYIEGRDENIFSLHTYIDREGRVVGWFTGQKIRTYPIHRGIGCFQLSVRNGEVKKVGLEMLNKIGYTGHAIVQVKQLPGSNAFQAFEINCRYSTWNYLHSKAGVRLPVAAYEDSLGSRPPILPEQREGVRWIDMANDIKAFRDYRRVGEWGWAGWLRTYVGRNCYAQFAWNDPMPWLMPRLARVRRAFWPTRIG